MHVTKLNASDAPRYRDLILAAYVDAADAFTSTVEERANEPISWWADRICAASGRSECFGAFVDAELVGAVALEYSAKSKQSHAALVLGMYVVPTARRGGVGRALMQAAVAAARARTGVCVLRLTATEGNEAALRLYESIGSTAWGTEPLAIRTPGGFRGKVHMTMSLGSAGD